MCRICLDDDDPSSMIAPCLCAGSSNWVHRGCLNEWRAQEQTPFSFTRCPSCHFTYHTHELTPGGRGRMWQVRALVTASAVGAFIALQGLLLLASYVIQQADTDGHISSWFPSELMRWRSSLGPYYVFSSAIFFALLTLVYLLLFVTGRLPRAPRGARRCLGQRCSYLPLVVGYGVVRFIPVLVGSLFALLLVFAFIGVFVAVFFTTVVVQYALQRYMHLLNMREEAAEHIVTDLSDKPELRRPAGR